MVRESERHTVCATSPAAPKQNPRQWRGFFSQGVNPVRRGPGRRGLFDPDRCAAGRILGDVGGIAANRDRGTAGGVDVNPG